MRTDDNKDRWLARLDPATGTLDLLDRQHDEAWIADREFPGSEVAVPVDGFQITGIIISRVKRVATVTYIRSMLKLAK